MYGSSPLARGLPPHCTEPAAGGGIIPARAGFTADLRPPDPLRADHPRSRGVYRTIPRSPPRRRRSRIIPARAGFTGHPGLPAGHREDHPRSRGVYPGHPGDQDAGAGSSPLARGLPMVEEDGVYHLGIIPARAGFTTTPRAPRGRTRGSSPLARGLPEGGLPGIGLPGIIPARAGFTATCSTPSSSTQDHPRSRGVYGGSPGGPAGQRGSSPLARGLRCPTCRR